MKPEFRMGQKVIILSSKKRDGRYNHGTIIGIEKYEDALYCGYINEKEFLSRFSKCRYKIVYIDVFTKKAGTNWVIQSELAKFDSKQLTDY